jgi:uncharacterized membrane protein YhdT
MSSLSKTALMLTLGYFILWCAGPLFIDKTWVLFGLPVWFWFSCILAPLVLILSLVIFVGRGHD